MTTQELSKALTEKHSEFCAYLASLNEQQFLFSKKEKWTAGQQLEHIILAVQPVRLAFTLPHWLLRLVWGKANRKSRTYEELVAKYLNKLQQGGKASGRFVPKPVAYKLRAVLVNTLQAEVAALLKKVNSKSDAALDAFVLPHPLLGKLTLREMLYFTVYHVQHHNELVLTQLKQANDHDIFK